MSSKKNLLPYIASAVVVIVLVAAIAIEFSTNSYSLNVIMSNNRTGVIFPYQTSIFTIKVINEGGATVKGLTVGLYQNGTELRHYTVTIPGHSNVTLKGNYTYRLIGNTSFQAVADPGRLLNVVNRNSTVSSVPVDISVPELPNVYKSIPNENVTSTQSFVLSGTGMYSASAVAQAYNLDMIDALFGTSKGMTVKIFDNLYGYIADVFGAYTSYANGTSSYIVWLQGTVTPGLVDYVTSTFRVPMSNMTINGTGVSFARVDNRTSMCTDYSNGWTKMLVYYNNSKNTTCLSFMGREYTPTESNSLVDALNTNNALSHYQSVFAYINSSKLGSSLPYSGSGVGVVNFFQNGYGVFAGYVQKSNSAINISSNRTCYGITYDNGRMHACSYIVVPINRSQTAGYGLVNTTEITPNYTVTLYSLVNASNLLPAHSNGAALIAALMINGSTERWVESPANFCLFNSSNSLGCSYDSFDYYDSIANLTITNRLGSSINITGVGCHLPGVKYTALLNATTVKGNSAISLPFPCYNMVNLPINVQNYQITVNYTRNNVNSVAVGILNVTTSGFPP